MQNGKNHETQPKTDPKSEVLVTLNQTAAEIWSASLIAMKNELQSQNELLLAQHAAIKTQIRVGRNVTELCRLQEQQIGTLELRVQRLEAVLVALTSPPAPTGEMN